MFEKLNNDANKKCILSISEKSDLLNSDYVAEHFTIFYFLTVV